MVRLWHGSVGPADGAACPGRRWRSAAGFWLPIAVDAPRCRQNAIVAGHEARVEELDETLLHRCFDAGALTRGRLYATEGRVSIVRVGPGHITASCRGSRHVRRSGSSGDGRPRRSSRRARHRRVGSRRGGGSWLGWTSAADLFARVLHGGDSPSGALTEDDIRNLLDLTG